jgi:hypothetical protein
MTFYPIEMFVNLYYVWAVFGGITAFFYGRAAWKLWRDKAPTVTDLRNDIGSLSLAWLVRTSRDWLQLGRYFVTGLTGFTFRRGMGGWPQIDEFMDEEPLSPFPQSLRLMVGITLGGMARCTTALYWAELNRDWMTTTNVWLPAVPIVLAIMADTNHHYTAWPKRPWIARLLFSVAMVYVALGLLVGI